jgi:hypothetical protein
MNILVLTGFTKHVVWNNYGNCDYGKYSVNINLQYATNNNYSFLCEILSEPLSDRWNTWIKIPLIKKHLVNYDYVVWIDADAIFVNNIKIENFIDDKSNLIISKNAPDTNHNKMWSMINTGFMIWKNSQWSFDTLTKIWDNSDNYKFDVFHEQTVLENLLLKNTTNTNLSNYDMNDLESAIYIDRIKVLPYSFHNFSENTNFVFHAAGDTPSKLNRLKKCYDYKNRINNQFIR